MDFLCQRFDQQWKALTDRYSFVLLNIFLKFDHKLEDSDHDVIHTLNRLVDLFEIDVRKMESRGTIVDELGGSLAEAVWVADMFELDVRGLKLDIGSGGDQRELS